MVMQPKAKKRRGQRHHVSRGHDNKKKGNKDTFYEERKVAEWTARLDAKRKRSSSAPPAQRTPETMEATRARTAAAEAADDLPNDGEKRVAVKFFWKVAGCPHEERWDGRDGTNAWIRKQMGDHAPWPASIKRTLLRCVEDKHADVAARVSGCGGRPRLLSEEDDVYIGMLLCDGYSQRVVMSMINAERRERDGDDAVLVTRPRIQEAEARIELIRRKRRKQKAGSCDEESEWCQASEGQSVQFNGQLESGEAMRLASMRAARESVVRRDRESACVDARMARDRGACRSVEGGSASFVRYNLQLCNRQLLLRAPTGTATHLSRCTHRRSATRRSPDEG